MKNMTYKENGKCTSGFGLNETLFFTTGGTQSSLVDRVTHFCNIPLPRDDISDHLENI